MASLDDDRSGTIDSIEFETALRDLSFQLTKLDYLELFGAVDEDGSRVLTVNEVPCAADTLPTRCLSAALHATLSAVLCWS